MLSRDELVAPDHAEPQYSALGREECAESLRSVRLAACRFIDAPIADDQAERYASPVDIPGHAAQRLVETLARVAGLAGPLVERVEMRDARPRGVEVRSRDI